MLSNIFVLRPYQAEPQQKRAEREGGIFGDFRFPHQRLLLVDRLCGDGQCQRDVRPDFTGVESAFKASPFQCASIKYGMQIQGVMLSST